MAQVFIAREKQEMKNGAIAWRSGGPMDCLGYYAKIQNCPIMVDNQEVARLTAYASGYADTAFSIPANTRRKGKHIGGYFTQQEDGPVFVVTNSYKQYF